MRRVVTNGKWTYTISPDADLPEGMLARAVVSARLLDELTGRPPRTSITIETATPGLSPRVAEDGLIGLAAIPTRVFTRLDTQPYTIPLEMAASGFVPIQRTVTLGPQASFPDTFAGIDLGDLDLHREPVVIRGRVTDAAGLVTTPVAGASVRITGLWRTPPPANVVVPPVAPNLISLSPRAYFDRLAAVGQVRQREMVPVFGDSRTLLEDAIAGSITLQVSNRIGVVAGDILLVDAGVAELAEYMTVQTLAGSASPDLPATITLTYALRNMHAANAVVERVTPQAPGADNALSADAVPGDVCLLLTGMAGLAAANVIEIHGGVQAAEYHICSRFETVTDASGYYRLPPLSRVAQLNLAVDDGVHPVQTQTITANYELVENLIDFNFV
jgi:hypothetical protein